MKNFIEKLVGHFDHPTIKKFKRIILFIFIGLIILDIIFVSIPKFPSISRVIYNSSPKFIVLIWLFGLLISNIFLQRKISKKVPIKRHFGILFFISLLFIILGYKINDTSKNITCVNYLTQVQHVETNYIIKILCRKLIDNNSFHYENCDCTNFNCDENTNFKFDFTNEVKLLILIFGILMGHIFWPQDRNNLKIESTG